VKYRWIYTFLQIVLHTTRYTQGSTDSPEPESITATKVLMANEEEVLPTQAVHKDLNVMFNGNIAGIRTLQNDTHQEYPTTREGHGIDTRIEVNTIPPSDVSQNNTNAGNNTLDTNTKSNTTDGILHDTGVDNTHGPGTVAGDSTKDDMVTVFVPELYDLSPTTILTPHKTIAPTGEPHHAVSDSGVATTKPSISSSATKPGVGQIDIIESEIPESLPTTTQRPHDTIPPTKQPPHETTKLILISAINNTALPHNSSISGGTNMSASELPEIPSATTLTPQESLAPIIKPLNDTTKLVDNSTKPTLSPNAPKPGVANSSTPDVSLVCGLNTTKENGSCACSSGWVPDPLVASDTLSCPCKDLCATAAGDYCPQDAVCVMESCSRMSCGCG
ncbi:unnamed protein product, partial [Meganyctiphanes norvegica]